MYKRQEPYRARRLVAFLDPFADAQNAGYQLVQSLYALGSGGFFGVGMGGSSQKMFYLPEAHNDFIMAVVGEDVYKRQAQIKAQEKAEARARARAVRRGSKEKTVLGEYRSELATKKTALPVRDSGTVPDVVGQSVRRAVEMFARQGLVPVIKGNGSRVVRQTPEPGVRWAGKDSAPTSCVLWLSEQE